MNDYSDNLELPKYKRIESDLTTKFQGKVPNRVTLNVGLENVKLQIEGWTTQIFINLLN